MAAAAEGMRLQPRGAIPGRVFAFLLVRWFLPSRSLVASGFVEEPYIRRRFRHEHLGAGAAFTPRSVYRPDVSRVYPNLDELVCQPAMRDCGAR